MEKDDVCSFLGFSAILIRKIIGEAEIDRAHICSGDYKGGSVVSNGWEFEKGLRVVNPLGGLVELRVELILIGLLGWGYLLDGGSIETLAESRGEVNILRSVLACLHGAL